jgi:hypothetical protein
MSTSAGIAPGPQHLRALAQANRIRLARADLKRRVAAQELTAAEVIVSCPPSAEGMSVSDLLMSQRRWGRKRCRRLLLQLGVPENKELGTLTDRQRVALASGLGVDVSEDAEESGERPASLGERELVIA